MRSDLLVHPAVKFLLCVLDVAFGLFLLFGSSFLVLGGRADSILDRLAGWAMVVAGCGLLIANYAVAINKKWKLRVRAAIYALIGAFALLAALDATLPREGAGSTTTEILSVVVFAVVCVANALISIRLLQLGGDSLNSSEEYATRRTD